MRNLNLQLKKTIPIRALYYLLRKTSEILVTINWKCSDKLTSLKNKHHGKPCYIIGNGPSINKQDLNLLKGKVTIACNSFYLKHPELSFTPTYYTVEDPLPAKDNKNEINALHGTTKIIPYDLRKTITSSKNTIYANFLRTYMRPKNSLFPLFSNNFSEHSYWGGTVIFFNLQLARYLGCNPIYLIGVDLTYTIPDDIKRYGNVLISQSDDPNHFNKDYFGKGKAWHLPEVDRMQKAFTCAYHALSKANIQLYNATHGGNLNVIPRIDYKASLSVAG